MPKAIRAYVRYVDAVNRVVGRFAMYLVFADYNETMEKAGPPYRY